MTEHNETERQENISEQTEVTNRMPVVRQLTVLGLVMVGIFSASFIPNIINALSGNAELQPAEVQRATNEEALEAERALNTLADVSIKGQSAFVWDVNTQRVLYEKDPDAQLPIASITKLMTALVAHEIIAQDTTVSVSTNAILQDGDSGLSDGETFSLGTLADLTLMSSSNDGAFAIAAAAGALLDEDTPAETFVEAMNIRAKELGLSQTYFRNPTGLDISETEAGAYGSARDIAFLMEYILENEPGVLEATTKAASAFYNQSGEYHEAENTNYAVRKIPGIIGSKTGYTTLSGGNLAIAFDASLNRPVIVVVLGSTYDGRFDDVLALTAAVRDAIE